MMKKKTRPPSSQPESSDLEDRKVMNPEMNDRQPQTSPSDSDHSFPIIGIGASAGGLEALELFLNHVPPNSGMAYVIVQHLDPTYKGIMAELLQHKTSMPVTEVKDRMRVEPDHVYLIPPNKDMSILNGVLHLMTPTAPRGLRLPIDYFFRTLADDQQERSIGVILSGMGSDGTLGLRAIKEKAGTVFVQSPASAKFDGMPRSAMDAGLADVVAPVEELPGKIHAFLKHPTFHSPDPTHEENVAQSGMEKILILLRSRTGQDFSLYKKNTIYRRIERRMALHQIDRIATYVRYMQENPQEVDLLYKELLIGVTNFFRDPAAWEQLKNEAIPALLNAHPEGKVLRAWTPGCSTGEEAYSLAMIFREVLEQVKPTGNFSLQIFATDLDKDAIANARQGFYPANIASDVSAERLQRFFVQEENGYRVGKEIREMVIFAPHNLAMDAPFTRLDLLLCRNLLIYLSAELQKKLIPIFYYSLNPGGFLFLGTSETVGSFNDLFVPLSGKNRLYQRLSPGLTPVKVDFPNDFISGLHESKKPDQYLAKGNAPVPNLQDLVEQQIMRQFAPAAVLANDQGDILYISGRTGKYLEPPAGKANWNLFAMAREGIRYELSNAFSKVLNEKTTVTVQNLTLGTNGGTQKLDLTLQLLPAKEGQPSMVLVVFNDIAAPPQSARRRGKNQPDNPERVIQLEQELLNSREELRSIRLAIQDAHEELRSTSEEYQSTNEELQSTNEELTTSKEEMQSLNEELQTVNHELQARVDELSRSNNDMKNLLNSTDIATLFLDDKFQIRRFTNQASKLIKLIPGDVGRPITDIASDVIYEGLEEDVLEVLRTLTFHETQISTRDGRWFTVRIMPYRTFDNRIDGVVITFGDISIAKRLELALREKEREVQALIVYLPQAFAMFETVFDPAGTLKNCRFLYVNAAFERKMHIKNENIHGKTMDSIYPETSPAWIEVCQQVVESGTMASFDWKMGQEGELYRCLIYRPGESQERLCAIFDGSGELR